MLYNIKLIYTRPQNTKSAFYFLMFKLQILFGTNSFGLISALTLVTLWCFCLWFFQNEPRRLSKKKWKLGPPGRRAWSSYPGISASLLCVFSTLSLCVSAISVQFYFTSMLNCSTPVEALLLKDHNKKHRYMVWLCVIVNQRQNVSSRKGTFDFELKVKAHTWKAWKNVYVMYVISTYLYLKHL